MYNILITGYPQVGKTSLINNIIRKLEKTNIGMFTNEIRKEGRRVGFKIETLSGLEYILASKDNLTSKYRVANYGVYLENIDTVIKHLELNMQESNPEVIIIDEIGKMELFSKTFMRFLERCLDSKKVLGTIMMKDNAYTKQIKGRSDTLVFHLTRDNQKMIEEKIMECFK